ncbi:MAG: SulP family inorganic anion transporter [Sulfuricaulis sp.]|uniref:SulP family inorganic anion transporter n=1 Tax=Sulfuricaulis sp. TaxID=2003553 RepID=UPI0034A50BDB
MPDSHPAPLYNIFWARFFPCLRWWPWVNRESLRSDLIAGLTGAAIVLPQGVAFAIIAGLPPVYGLYTAMAPPIIAALFGSSHHLVSGPAIAISIAVFASVSKFAEPGSAQYISMALTLTFMVGAYQLAFGLARMGALVNFVSHSVIVGFIVGAAILIATSQLKHFLGIEIPSGESFLNTWQHIFQNINTFNPYVTAVAVVTLLSGVTIMHYKPRWPGLMLAMIIGSLLAAAFGAESKDIKLIGEFPAQLPPLSCPEFSLTSLKSLGSGAFAIAMLGLVMAISIAKSVALKSGQRIDSSQEFIGQGLANMVGSFFSSYASSGSFTRSGINYTSGAITPMASIFAAVSLALIVLIIAPLAAHLPIAAMSGILLIVAYRLVEFQLIANILRTSKREAAVLLTTFLATLFVDLEFAIYIGVILSLVIYLMRTAHPGIVTRTPDPNQSGRHMVTDPKLPECPQLKIVRVDGSLFFGAVDHVQNEFERLLAQNPSQKHLMIIGNGINFIDIAGARMLVQEARRRRGAGGGVYLSKVKDEVYGILNRGGFIHDLGVGNVFTTKNDAIKNIFDRLDKSICERCDKRIFLECQSVEYRGEIPLKDDKPATT